MEPGSKDHDSALDRYFIRNTAGISMVEIFWGLGLPVVLESTFLQLFLKNLGASSFVIGLVPTFFFIGVSVFSLFSGFFTAHLESKRTAVIIFHIFTALPVLLFGIFLNIAGFIPGTIKIFFITYALFSMGVGLILPTWQNYLVKIYSSEKIITGHAFMWISQSLGKFLSGFFILKIITKYSFSSEGASLIFTLVGTVFLTGSLMFFVTKEIPGKKEKSVSGRARMGIFIGNLKKAIRNRNFLLFMASDFEQYAIISIMAFYANYATEYCSIKASTAAGLFIIFNYSGNIIINIIFGWMNLFKLKTKFFIAKALSLTAVILLILSQSLWAFLAASFLMGVSRGTRSLVFLPVVKIISGHQDSTGFFSIAPILIMPMSIGMPLLAGAFLDRFSYLGGDSYRIMFSGMIGFIILGIFLFAKVHLERENN